MSYKPTCFGISMSPDADRLTAVISLPPSLPLKICVGKLIFFLVTFQYDFSGRRDIVRFIKQIQAKGLYASLRIGPYVESEWSYG